MDRQRPDSKDTKMNSYQTNVGERKLDCIERPQRSDSTGGAVKGGRVALQEQQRTLVCIKKTGKRRKRGG